VLTVPIGKIFQPAYVCNRKLAEAKEGKHRKYDDDEANDVNDLIHVRLLYDNTTIT
jgi:hypothetical protein